MKHFPEDGVAMAGVRGPLKLDDALFMVGKAARIGPVQILRADRVLGVDHLRSAARHAARALEEGRNHADRPEVEFTRYASGERQIKKALQKMGLPDPVQEAVVVGLGDNAADAVDYFVDGLGLVEDDGLLEAREGDLEAFGVSGIQVEATTPSRHPDLVLEMVAAVDTFRK